MLHTLRRGRNWLTRGGAITLVQPWAVLPGPLLLLLALVASNRWLFALGYAYGLLLAVSYGWVRLVGPRINLERRLASDVQQVGDTLTEVWRLHNASPLPLLWLEIDGASTLPGYNGRRVVAAAAGAVVIWETTAQCERRGVYQVGPLHAHHGDPFGIFRYQWQTGSAHAVVVYPPLVRLNLPRMPHGQRGGQARADLLQIYTTPNVGGLREYTPGDAPSRIHWPSVARNGRLMIKEFDQEQAGALWIVLDVSQAAYATVAPALNPPHAQAESYTQTSQIGPSTANVRLDSPLELAITLAGSLAAHALAEGRQVGLLANDGRRIMVAPGRGSRQLWLMLHQLVDVAATGSLPLGELIQQTRLGQRSSGALALITPALNGMWLPALARNLANVAVHWRC